MHQVNPSKLPASCGRVAFALTPGSKLHQKKIGTLDAILMLLVTFQIRRYSQDVKCSNITGNFSRARLQTVDMEGRVTSLFKELPWGSKMLSPICEMQESDVAPCHCLFPSNPKGSAMAMVVVAGGWLRW